MREEPSARAGRRVGDGDAADKGPDSLWDRPQADAVAAGRDRMDHHVLEDEWTKDGTSKGRGAPHSSFRDW